MAQEDHAHLLDALAAIPVAALTYQEWTDCGMALHESGFGWQDWDAWSREDSKRYHEGECERKWASFGNGSERVTSGTIIHLAERYGWQQPTSADAGQLFDWDDVGVASAVGPDATEAASIPVMDADDGSAWDPAGMCIEYLDTIFDDDDIVGYVCDAWQREGEDKWLPSKGVYVRTAGDIKREIEGYRLNGHADALEMALGAWEPAAGAWIRFNPLDGSGVDNKNVTKFRYALIESDVLDIDRQLPAIKDLHLPCAAVVSSGGKSVHAVVHVDAANADEYRKRVRWLYDYCDRHGFVVDRNNKNPSRLSRLPGATRAGRRQLLLATNIGEESWDAWRAWAEESEDDLPDAEYDDWDKPIVLKPELIGTGDTCILRQGAKMIVVGDSKMGKSYTLIDLTEAICCGGEWLGMQCAAGPVFYVNLEIDPEEFRWRQHVVWEARPDGAEDGLTELMAHNFVRWNLRGYATNMDKLAPRLVRRVLQCGPPGTFKAIVIDPIYKVNGGDDNNASEVSKFTNTLDMIIMSCGCSVIYAHHHPKGATGGRKAIDRMSGSGVYGRDADTVMDFSPLFVPEDILKEYQYKPIFRAEVNCRSFGYRAPIDCIFDWPRFRRDTEGRFKDCKPLGADTRHEGRINGNETSTNKYAKVRQKITDAMRDAYDTCEAEEVYPTAENMYERMQWDAFGLSDKSGTSLKTFLSWFKNPETAGAFKLGGTSKKATKVKGVPIDHLVSLASEQ